MAACICTVGGNVHLYQIVAFQIVILLGRNTNGSILGQYDDTVVACTYANLILCTDHAQALHTTQLAALDDKFLVAVVQLGTYHGNNHLLTGGNIRSTAHYLQGGLLTNIHTTYMHVVTIGVLFTCENLTCPQAFQTSLYALYFLHATYLQTYTGQCRSHFFGGEVDIHVFTKPFVRNIHNNI